MSTQPVDRAADGTEVFLSVTYVICKWIDWLESSRNMGRYYEGYLVHNVHTVHTVHTAYTVHITYNIHTIHIIHTVLTVYNTVQQMLDD